MRFVTVLFLLSCLVSPALASVVGYAAGERPVPTSRVLSADPAIAAARKVNGAVLIDVQVSAEGRVIGASVVSGPQLLRAPAQKAGLLWRFEPLRGAGGVRSGRLTFIFHEPSYTPPEREPEFTCPYQLEVRWVAAH